MISVRIGKRNVSLVTVITTLAAVVGSLSAILAYGAGLWVKVGWETPNTHSSDVQDLRGQIGLVELMGAEIEKALAGAVEEFRDEWKCDEYQEELGELLDKRQRGEATERDIERIRQLQELIGTENLKCARFIDD